MVGDTAEGIVYAKDLRDDGLYQDASRRDSFYACRHADRKTLRFTSRDGIPSYEAPLIGDRRIDQGRLSVAEGCDAKYPFDQCSSDPARCTFSIGRYLRTGRSKFTIAKPGSESFCAALKRGLRVAGVRRAPQRLPRGSKQCTGFGQQVNPQLARFSQSPTWMAFLDTTRFQVNQVCSRLNGETRLLTTSLHWGQNPDGGTKYAATHAEIYRMEARRAVVYLYNNRFLASGSQIAWSCAYEVSLVDWRIRLLGAQVFSGTPYEPAMCADSELPFGDALPFGSDPAALNVAPTSS